MMRTSLFLALCVALAGCGGSDPHSAGAIKRTYSQQIEFLKDYAHHFDEKYHWYKQSPPVEPDTSVLELPEIIQASVFFSSPTSQHNYIVSGLFNNKTEIIPDVQEPTWFRSVANRGTATMRDGTIVDFIQFQGLIHKKKDGHQIGYEILFHPNKMTRESEQAESTVPVKGAPSASSTVR